MSDIERLQKRLERERRARKHAEELIEEKSRLLYDANNQLEDFNAELERRVETATTKLLENNVQLEKRVRELGALNSVTTAICSVMELNALLDRVLSVAKDIMNAEASSLLLLDKESGTLRFHIAKGKAGKQITGLSVLLGQGIAGTVAQTEQPECIADAYADCRFDPSFDQQSGIKTKSLLVVPVINKGKLIGVAEVMNKIDGTAFGQDDLKLFESMLSASAVALENARLFATTKALADDLRDALEKERNLSIEKEKMGAYIPTHLMDEISKNREKKLALGGKSMLVTILFSDIKGFTQLSERLEPQRLIAGLNSYMTEMTNIISSHDGIVDKFLGDGIMAIFTPNNELENHVLRAVHAGVCMQQKMHDLRHHWRNERPELEHLQMRIGINTGEVVAGNIGSQTRMDYTVVGDNVNVASRIESNCEPDQVYISDSCYQIVADTIKATKMEPLFVKNREQAVQTYAIKVDSLVSKK